MIEDNIIVLLFTLLAFCLLFTHQISDESFYLILILSQLININSKIKGSD